MDVIFPKLFGFVLVLTRVSAFFVSIPLFSWPAIPTTIKIAMALLITIFFSIVTPLPPYIAHVGSIEAALVITNEAIYGFALGLAVTMLFSVVKIAATIIEQEMGLNMAELFDPLTGEPAQAVSMFLEMVFILLLFSANIHHLFLTTIAKSYVSFPIGSTPDITTLLAGIISAGSQMLLLAFQLAAPLLAASLVLMVVLAIASKVMPDMDIFFISLPLKIGLGLVMVAFILPYLNSYVAEFATLINKLLPI
jgi:flagellar biosynthesis protein FliR